MGISAWALNTLAVAKPDKYLLGAGSFKQNLYGQISNAWRRASKINKKKLGPVL